MSNMNNVIAETGYWVSNDDNEHRFIPELSIEINKYVKDHDIKTAYDFGCGRGEYLNELVKEFPSIKATGFEGHQIEGVYNNIVKLDLSTPLKMEKVDLVISIEVGEHIPAQYEQVFLDNIVNHSSRHIILSWAVEGQPGLGHVNCKNNDYIIDQMEKRGWEYLEDVAQDMRSRMPDIWIKNTLMVYRVK